MDDEQERRAKARQLRAEADQDERTAHECAEDNPTYSGYLEKRPQWKRYLANNEDAGAGA